MNCPIQTFQTKRRQIAYIYMKSVKHQRLGPRRNGARVNGLLAQLRIVMT